MAQKIRLKNKSNGIVSFVDKDVWEQNKHNWKRVFVVVGEPVLAPQKQDLPELKDLPKEDKKIPKK